MNSSNQPRMLDTLTGLRFVAAFCVFLHHARERLSIESWNLGPLGGFAVGFFFVLSGFILMHVYGHTLNAAGISRFLVARFARVWPLHIACLALFVLLFRWHNLPSSPDELLRLLAQVTLTQTWDTRIDEILGYNGVAWSISVEAFFYALFPLLCMLDDRRFLRAFAAIGAATIMAVAIAEWSVGLHPDGRAIALTVLHFAPPMRLFEFATGIATARIAARWPATSGARTTRDTAVEIVAFSLVALGFLCLGPAQWIRYVIAPDTLPVAQEFLPKGAGFTPAFAFLILWMARSHGMVAKLLSLRPLVFLGEISLAFYMVHAMILMLFQDSGVGIGAAWPLGFVLALAASLAAASLLHLAIENPARELILAAWDGKLAGRWRKAVLEPVAGWRRAPALASVATLLICAWIAQSTVAEERAAHAAERIGAAPTELRDVVFADEAVIVAAHGEIEGECFNLAIVYDPLPQHTRSLFVHVTAGKGKILRQLMLRDVEFVAPDGQVLRLATADVPLAELDGASSVGIGFWSQGLGASKANRGPLTMGGHRLEVFAVPGRAGS